MKNLVLLFFILIIITEAQTTDENNITATAMNYIEGWYTADASRMDAALHPNLAKRRVVNANEIWDVTKERMLTLTRNGNGASPPENRRIEIQILDISNDMAIVKIISNNFFDYVSMVNYNNHWRIVNVLWEYHEIDYEGDTDSVPQKVQNYIEYIYESNSIIQSSIIDPRAKLRKSISDTQVDEASLNWLTNCKVNNIWTDPNFSLSDYTFTVLDAVNNSACAKVETPHGTEYLHLTSYDDEWKIINILWQRSTEVTSIGLKSFNSTLVNSYELAQNYPNPFNPSTTINFYTPRTEKIRLSIYSMDGQLIRDLVNNQMIPGEYTIQWDSTSENGNTVSSGIYIYSLFADNFTTSKKMILLR